MEAGAKLAGKNLWYQIYGARDRAVAADLVKPCAIDLGLTTLAVTPATCRCHRTGSVTVATASVRPMRMTLPTILEAMLHPAWVINYYRTGGLPMLGNWQPYAAKRRDRG